MIKTVTSLLVFLDLFICQRDIPAGNYVFGSIFKFIDTASNDIKVRIFFKLCKLLLESVFPADIISIHSGDQFIGTFGDTCLKSHSQALVYRTGYSFYQTGIFLLISVQDFI